LYISKLRLYQFRNLVDQSIELNSGAVFITGDNGNGKTNLVESLYLLSGSRSFRTNSSSEFVKWGCDRCSVFGTAVSQHGEYELGLIFHPGKREGIINGDPVSSFSDFLGKIAVIAFAPTDLAVVKGSPQGRRKFLDRHMVDRSPSLLKVLISYQRALANKSAVLKESGATPEKLAPWNALLAEYGAILVRERVSFLADLEHRAAQYHESYAASDGSLTLTLESDFNKKGVLDVDGIRNLLDSLSAREIAQRMAVSGVHRDDVMIALGGADARSFASQGQTRSTVLSLKLGVIDMVEASIGESPIVLLDDVDSELDGDRGARLFGVLLQKQRQILVTGTGKPPYQLAGLGGLQTIRVMQGKALSE
jgi:DNA replication and repair protein RecF